MGGILLPARVLFVEFVSDDWLGSLGIISILSLLVILLAKYNKLGFFGPMLERQMFKFQKGKRGILLFAESVFLLIILGTMIFAIDQGHSIYDERKMNDVSDYQNSKSQLFEFAKNMTPSDWIFGTLMAPVGFVTAFPQMSLAMASIDQKLDGWLMHFYTVGFVEYLELLGILIFYRISFKRKTSHAVSKFEVKTPI